MRVGNVADFETVAHEAGHALEKRVGPDLTRLVDRFRAELAPLDYDAARMDSGEGFAEWMRATLTNPAYGARQAPGFAPAFRAFMAERSFMIGERILRPALVCVSKGGPKAAPANDVGG